MAFTENVVLQRAGERASELERVRAQGPTRIPTKEHAANEAWRAALSEGIVTALDRDPPGLQERGPDRLPKELMALVGHALPSILREWCWRHCLYDEEEHERLTTASREYLGRHGLSSTADLPAAKALLALVDRETARAGRPVPAPDKERACLCVLAVFASSQGTLTAGLPGLSLAAALAMPACPLHVLYTCLAGLCAALPSAKTAAAIAGTVIEDLRLLQPTLYDKLQRLGCVGGAARGVEAVIGSWLERSFAGVLRADACLYALDQVLLGGFSHLGDLAIVVLNLLYRPLVACSSAGEVLRVLEDHPRRIFTALLAKGFVSLMMLGQNAHESAARDLTLLLEQPNLFQTCVDSPGMERLALRAEMFAAQAAKWRVLRREELGRRRLFEQGMGFRVELEK